MKERIRWIDNAKAYAFLCFVSTLQTTPPIYTDGIYTVFLTMFFSFPAIYIDVVRLRKIFSN